MAESGGHRDEILQAWTDVQPSLKSALPMEVVQYFFDPPSVALLPVLDLLDRVRSGHFQLVCVFPPAATWSQVPGQPPLRSRSCPFGLDDLDPDDTERVIHANACCEFSAWIAEQAACCSQCRLVLAFPEDFGGHYRDGPASVWACHEYQMLENLREARRGAAFLCQLSSVDHWRPLGFISDIPDLLARLSPGWPSLQPTDTALVYTGPLPKSCPCALPHRPTKGAKSASVPHTADAVLMGSLFWQRCFHDLLKDCFPATLRDGGSLVRSSSSFSCSAPSSCLGSAPRFSSCPGSQYDVYVQWHSGGLTRHTLRDVVDSALVSKFFDVPLTNNILADGRSTLGASCETTRWKHSPGSSCGQTVSAGKRGSVCEDSKERDGSICLSGAQAPFSGSAGGPVSERPSRDSPQGAAGVLRRGQVSTGASGSLELGGPSSDGFRRDLSGVHVPPVSCLADRGADSFRRAVTPESRKPRPVTPSSEVHPSCASTLSPGATRRLVLDSTCTGSSPTCPSGVDTSSRKRVARSCLRSRIFPLKERSRSPRRTQAPLATEPRGDGNGRMRLLPSLSDESGKQLDTPKWGLCSSHSVMFFFRSVFFWCLLIKCLEWHC